MAFNRHLAHQAGREDLAAHLAGVHSDGSLPGELLGPVNRSRHAIGEMA